MTLGRRARRLLLALAISIVLAAPAGALESLLGQFPEPPGWAVIEEEAGATWALRIYARPPAAEVVLEVAVGEEEAQFLLEELRAVLDAGDPCCRELTVQGFPATLMLFPQGLDAELIVRLAEDVVVLAEALQVDDPGDVALGFVEALDLEGLLRALGR